MYVKNNLLFRKMNIYRKRGTVTIATVLFFEYCIREGNLSKQCGNWEKEVKELEAFKLQFYTDFIKDDRWKYLTEGLKTTITVTFFAVILGIIIGFVIAMIRATADKNGSLKIPNFFCRVYLTVIRGTPAMIQLMIMYYIIFGTSAVDKKIVAILAFGINSGAYVAEIVRSGIMSIEEGQFEAGRSFGLTYIQTMWYIILPQAFKNVLPALANEFIVLLKETSICGYIALTDLTHGGNIIRSQTYDPYLPLLGAAAIYLVMVCGLSAAVTRLERRLRTNER